MESLVKRISDRADIPVDKARKALAATLMDLGTGLVAEPETDGVRTGDVVVTRPPPPGAALCPPAPIMLNVVVTRPPPEDHIAPPPPPPPGKAPAASLHYIAHTGGITEGQARIVLDMALDELNHLGRRPSR